MKVNASLLASALLCTFWVAVAGEPSADPAALNSRTVQVWELPKGQETNPAQREGWKPARTGNALPGGAVLENGKILLLAAPGGDGVRLVPAAPGLKGSAQVVPVASGKALGKISGVKLERQDEMEATLKVSFPGADLSLSLKPGQPFISVLPSKGVEAIEVGGRTAYAVMPDFFGHDVVYDPKRLKSDTVTVPADNFLLNLQVGGDAIIMCAWQGPLSLGMKKKGDEREPRVDLVQAGQGAERLVEKTRHECDGQPLYVALLAKKGLWFEKDLSGDQAQKPMALDWERPYEANWRALFLGRDGAFCNDMMVKDVTWDVKYDSEWGGRRDGAGHPAMWFQGAWVLFTLPAWIQDKSSKKTFVSIYADYVPRVAARDKNNALRAQAKKENTPFVEEYPPNIFDRLVVYAIDRRKDTPLTESTPTDVMRESLGIGPCEYVLDREGLKENTTRNGHYVHPTCYTFDTWISKFAAAAKGQNSSLPEETRNGKKGVPLAGLKAEEKFQPEDLAILVERLDDFGWFVETINKRLQQYNKFGKSLGEFCNAAVAQNPATKPLADAVLKEVQMLLKHCPDERLAGMTKESANWKKRVDGVIEEVKTGVYKNIASTGAIRDFAVNQDNLMGVCHRLVKGMRQAASAVDTSDVEVTKFANRLRALCHDMLRNKGHFEY